jgi:hypothetical protein
MIRPIAFAFFLLMLVSSAWMLAPSTAAMDMLETDSWAKSDSPDSPEAYILLDGFEDPGWPDPNLWQVRGSGTPNWWPSNCRFKSGSRGLWAFGGLIGSVEQPCGAGAPRGSRSTIYQHLDFRSATLASRLELYFELWMQMPAGEDGGFFIFLHVPQGSGAPKRVPIFGATGDSGNWAFPIRKLDLMNLADVTAPAEVYDLRGSEWTLEWVGLAPNGTLPGAGIYLDDLSLVWEPAPGITPPTARPTSRPATATPSPTATSNPSPSATSSATASPTMTATPVRFGATYLPVVFSFWPPPPTATASPTAGPEPTASSEPEPTASAQPGPTASFEPEPTESAQP